MTNYVKIAGAEHEARFVRFRGRDSRHNGRATVTILLDKAYEEVNALFSSPGKWSVVRRDDAAPDHVTDCTAYEILCSITDWNNGVLEVVMGRATDRELLQAIMGSADDSKI